MITRKMTEAFICAIISLVLFSGAHGSFHRILQEGPRDHCVAVVRTRTDPNKKFFGLEGSPTLYKPVVQGSQWSAARMKLSRGPDSIEVGWMVNPGLFHDGEAHLYVRFTAGGKGCINTQCPGFVYVGKEVPLGQSPDGYSEPGGEQYYWKFWIDKHKDDGHWWVSMDDDKYQIGYWPKSLFSSTGLADVADQVEWGGEIDNPGSATPMPGMGASTPAVYDTKWSALFQHVTVVDEGYHNIDPPDTEKYMSCDTYNVLDGSYQGEILGRLIFYGGPKPHKKSTV